MAGAGFLFLEVLSDPELSFVLGLSSGSELSFDRGLS